MNNGVVYSVFAYEAHNQDELTFDDGDRIVVLRKGDDAEREWWWSRIDDREGYVPRNLLGVSWVNCRCSVGNIFSIDPYCRFLFFVRFRASFFSSLSSPSSTGLPTTSRTRRQI